VGGEHAKTFVQKLDVKGKVDGAKGLGEVGGKGSAGLTVRYDGLARQADAQGRRCIVTEM